MKTVELLYQRFTIGQITIKNKGFQKPETLTGLVPRAGIEPAHHLSDTGF